MSLISAASPIRKLAVCSTALLLSACAHTAGTPVAQPSPASETAAAGVTETPRSELPVSGLDFPYVTQHQLVVNGQRISYTARVGSLNVPDGEGKPGASIVSTAYLVDQAVGSAPRPVMFVFNGGPISPSIYLHMGAFGPKRVAFDDDITVDVATAPLVDNPHSILDVADLVYFDRSECPWFNRAAKRHWQASSCCRVCTERKCRKGPGCWCRRRGYG